ncbi:hypothetical protein FM112_00150 [Gulosibacter sp. 10]|nr:hypothetical protein FM112_00150 [Gulosibacter sp. 10]
MHCGIIIHHCTRPPDGAGRQCGIEPPPQHAGGRDRLAVAMTTIPVERNRP